MTLRVIFIILFFNYKLFNTYLALATDDNVSSQEIIDNIFQDTENIVIEQLDDKELEIFETYSNSLNTCPITENNAIDDYEPEEFSKNNNLLRKSGQKPYIKSIPLLIKGRLVNEECIPISNAKINIWHADHKGLFSYKMLRNINNINLYNHENDTTFVGNGETFTNNFGEFQFITIFPGTNEKIKNSYINIRVNHQNFGIKEYKFDITQDEKIEYDNITIQEMINSLTFDTKITLPKSQIYDLKIVVTQYNNSAI